MFHASMLEAYHGDASTEGATLQPLPDNARLRKEGRAVKVRDRNPGVLVVTVPFPANEILGFAPEPPVAKNLLYFILNMTVRKPDGRWSRGAAGERRIGCVGRKKRS